jgi:AmiR/NasT family two-component response regulator
VVIEQAKGILAEQGNLDMDQAFQLLREQARTSNRRLAVVAGEVIAQASGAPGTAKRPESTR